MVGLHTCVVTFIYLHLFLRIPDSGFFNLPLPRKYLGRTRCCDCVRLSLVCCASLSRPFQSSKISSSGVLTLHTFMRSRQDTHVTVPKVAMLAINMHMQPANCGAWYAQALAGICVLILHVVINRASAHDGCPSVGCWVYTTVRSILVRPHLQHSMSMSRPDCYPAPVCTLPGCSIDGSPQLGYMLVTPLISQDK